MGWEGKGRERWRGGGGREEGSSEEGWKKKRNLLDRYYLLFKLTKLKPKEDMPCPRHLSNKKQNRIESQPKLIFLSGYPDPQSRVYFIPNDGVSGQVQSEELRHHERRTMKNRDKRPSRIPGNSTTPVIINIKVTSPFATHWVHPAQVTQPLWAPNCLICRMGS